MQQYDTAPLAQWISHDRRSSGQESKEVRRCVLDAMACLAIGWNTDASRDAARALKKGQQGMIARAVRYGTAIHALDFDDAEIPGSTHPSAVILAALLPLAEQLDSSMDELVRAYIAGFETIVWFGRTFGFRHHQASMHATATIGLFGAVAACANLLDRTPLQIQSGLSLACSYAEGLQRRIGSGAKPMHVGIAAANALMIVPLITAGYRAGSDAWNGPAGYMARHRADQGNSDFSNTSLGANSAFATEGVVRKAFPGCRHAHRLIQAAIGFSKRIDVADIERIELEVPVVSPDAAFAGNGTSGHGASLSVAYCVGSALVDGGFGLASFTSQALKRQSVCALMTRTETRPYPVEKLDTLSPDTPDRIRIFLGGGRLLEDEIGRVPGSREQPLDDHALVAKSLQCFSARYKKAEAKRLVKLVLQDAFQVREVLQSGIG